MDEHQIKRLELLEERLHDHIEHYASNNKTLALLSQRMDSFSVSFSQHDLKEVEYQKKIDAHFTKMDELIQKLTAMDIDAAKQLVSGYKGILSIKNIVVGLAAVTVGLAALGGSILWLFRELHFRA